MTVKITAQLIKDLRERTGVGMTKCKQALEEAGGDVELAIANLRKAGMASAVKKEGRAANEGVIGSFDAGDMIIAAEVNAETDFVVNNDRFQQFVKDVVEEIANTKPASLEAFLGQKFSKDPNLTMDEYRATIVQAIGENIQLRRILVMPKAGNHSIAIYSHLGGKILTVVEIEGSDSEQALAKDIAMHVAAAEPDFLAPEDVPADVIAHEKDIAKVQMKGKPENIIEKILEGKLRAFYDDVCLKKQKFIKDDSVTIEQLVEKRGKEISKPLTLASFTRWKVGQ